MEQITEDPRYLEAREMILKIVKDHQKDIQSIRPPLETHKEEYDWLIEHMSQLRGAELYYPYLGTGRGNGALVELADGSVKYDFIIGIGVHYWGHSHPDIIRSSIDAAVNDTVMQGNLQQNLDTLKMMELLTNASGYDHCFLTTSGAMANENALKIAFQKNTPAHRILAFEGCFAGRSTTLAHITYKEAYREGLPKTVEVDYVPFYNPEDPEGSTKKSLEVLRKHLNDHPGEYSAMMMELIQGEGGFNVGSKEFFTTIISELKKEGILTIADEVQSFGRTPKLFAFQYFELEGLIDIVTIGKLSQVCATFFNQEIAPKPGLLSQTFTASTSSIQAGIVIIESLLKGHYLGPNGRINEIHQRFANHLEEIQKRHPGKIEGPWGIGTMVAFTPFYGDAGKVVAFARRLYEKGVISFLAGGNKKRIRFLVPAGCITNDDIDIVMNIVEEALQE